MEKFNGLSGTDWDLVFREFQSHMFHRRLASDWRSLRDWSMKREESVDAYHFATSRWSKHFWTLCFSCIWLPSAGKPPLYNNSQVQLFLFFCTYSCLISCYPSFLTESHQILIAKELQYKLQRFYNKNGPPPLEDLWRAFLPFVA